jgi:oligopeptide/dipeptide ABC transporter ATP-binding protein
MEYGRRAMSSIIRASLLDWPAECGSASGCGRGILLTIPGNPPNLLRLPKGCPFQPRCPHAMEICNSAPPLEEFAPGRLRACFKPVEDLV